jgi:PIN domain nuclease of toxin-antitoxin system
MKTTFVFDACAMIAHFRNEPGANKVRQLFFTPEAAYKIHALNVCEVFYDFIRSSDEKVAKGIMDDINSLGIEICEDIDEELRQEAGRIKATFKRVSLADCFALALAKRDNAILVTSDHHEFDRLIDQNICLIYFIR